MSEHQNDQTLAEQVTRLRGLVENFTESHTQDYESLIHNLERRLDALEASSHMTTKSTQANPYQSTNEQAFESNTQGQSYNSSAPIEQKTAFTAD